MASDLPNDSSDHLSELPARADTPLFVYVRLPIDIDPVERDQRFGHPIDSVLQLAGFGEVTGGGSLLSEPGADGNRTVEYCGIDVDLTNPRDGIDLLISELRNLSAPQGTVLEFRLGGESVELAVYDNAH